MEILMSKLSGTDIINIGIWISIIIGGLIFYKVIREDKQARIDFINECLNDGKKAYECKALYGQSLGAR